MLSRKDRVSAVPALNPRDIFRTDRSRVQTTVVYKPAPPSSGHPRPSSARTRPTRKAGASARRPMSAKYTRASLDGVFAREFSFKSTID